MCVASSNYSSAHINTLLGYYVIAIILSVITALVTIYHHQIVAQLTPAAHTIKKSVIPLLSQSCLTLSDHDLHQASRRVGDPDSHPLHPIFPSGVSIFPLLGLPPVDHIYHSSSVTKLLPSFVALFGVFGLDSRLWPLAHFLEN